MHRSKFLGRGVVVPLHDPALLRLHGRGVGAFALFEQDGGYGEVELHGLGLVLHRCDQHLCFVRHVAGIVLL